MKSFFAFFLLIPFPLAMIAMVENTTEANVWYHVGFIVFLLLAACVGGLISDARHNNY